MMPYQCAFLPSHAPRRRRNRAARLSKLCVFQLLLIVLAAQSAWAQSFGPSVNLTAGLATRSVAAGDFNGDGHPDLLAVSSGDATGGKLSFFAGAGDGSFGAKVDFPAVSNAYAIVAGDFNGDGKLDAAVANSNTAANNETAAVLETVSIFLGNGDGTFQPANNLPVDNQAKEVITADFNADAKIDLAVVCNDEVDVLLGNGDGTFQPRLRLGVSVPSLALVGGDFNGDGKADLAATNNIPVDENMHGGIDMFLGNGDGTFQPRVNVLGIPHSLGLAAGDLNGDGKLDLALVNTSAAALSIVLGNGDGTFQPKTDYSVNTIPGTIAAVEIADLSGDGKSDLAVTDRSLGLVTLAGNGDGTLRTPLPFSVGTGGAPVFVNTGDLNHDNKIDLLGVTVGNANNGTVHVLLNKTGLLSVSGVVRDDGGAPLAGVTVRLTGPEAAPVMVTSKDDGSYSFDSLAAGGTFTVTPARTHYTFSPASRTIENLSANTTADFTGTLARHNISGAVVNQDGAPAGGVTVTLGGGAAATTTTGPDGRFAFTSLPAGGNYTVTPTLPRFMFSPASLAFNNLSGNRTGFFVAFPRTFTISGTVRDTVRNASLGGVNVILSGSRAATATTSFDGTYSFTGLPIGGDYTVTVAPALTLNLFSTYTLAPPLSRKFTNLSSDMTADFAGALFATAVPQTSGGVSAVGDFDGDGHLDLLTTEGIVIVRLLRGRGDGSFHPPTDVQVGFGGAVDVVAADFNGDGKLDIAGSDPFANVISVLFGNGDGTFQSRTAYPVGFDKRPASLIAADFNGDGKPDLAAGETNRNFNEDVTGVALFINKGDGTFNPLTRAVVQPFAVGVNAGDYNKDGKLDLVTANFSGLANHASVLLGNGDGTFAAPVTYAVGQTPRLVEVGDFNKDGNLDLVTSNRFDVSVLLGNGDGTLQPAVNYANGAGVGSSGGSSLAQADFNGDGAIDVAVIISGSVVMLTGKGDGSFNAPVMQQLGFALGGLAANDFNHDNRPDLLTLVLGGTNSIPASARTLLNVAAAPTFKFGAGAYTAGEGDGAVVITVTRSGDLSQPAAVDYATSNETASDRTDYLAAVGTLRFAAGEASKTFNVFITNDVLVEDGERLNLSLGNPVGGTLGATPTATLTINSDDSTNTTANPIDETTFFVRQHYRDFLGRDPDADGLAFWSNGIESCGADQQCREVKRVDTSAAFFLSIEFQETGYLAYRMYKAAYGDAASDGVPGTVPAVRLREFLADAQRVGQGVQVGVGDWQQQLEANKATYALEFVQRARFTAAFPTALTAEDFVNKLAENTGAALSPEERAALLAVLGATPQDATKRAQAVRTVAEDAGLRQAELNRAFVLMQYYGYLRRNPDDPQDTNFGGWRFWLDKLDQFNGNFVQAEMVKAFITSIEYRQRFGQ